MHGERGVFVAQTSPGKVSTRPPLNLLWAIRRMPRVSLAVCEANSEHAGRHSRRHILSNHRQEHLVIISLDIGLNQGRVPDLHLLHYSRRRKFDLDVE